MRMGRARYKEIHRVARMGNLGPMAFMVGAAEYDWFLCEVYDLRFPHIGGRHLFPRSFEEFGRRPSAWYRFKHQGARAERVSK